MMKQTLPALVLATLIGGGGAWAAGPGEPPDPPRGPGAGPHYGPGLPSAEMLATIDGLGAAQQADVRRILRERRDADEALRARLRSEREAIGQRERTERERIEDQTTQKLRVALGEDGYHAYVRWATQRGPGPLPSHAPPAPHGDRAGAPLLPPAADGTP